MRRIYVETAVMTHPTTQRILKGVARKAVVIECDHYGEVFNPKSQNFRLQKQDPALIIAAKTGRLVLPTPESFGIGGQHNYYFSHMLNCVYDCRYCFLQGMYQSANYVHFVNFNDFMRSIDQVIAQHAGDPCYFFSGYDCDSLAYEPVTQFVREFVPFFAERPQAILELRTKSTNIRQLLQLKPVDNVVIAYSLTPDLIATQVEHKAPSVPKRLQALQALVDAGWRVGVRLDPLIYADDYQVLYRQLIQQVFAVVKPQALHSVSLGPLRFPEKMYRRITKLYPQDKLLAHPLHKRGQHRSYRDELEQAMKQFVTAELSCYVDDGLLFECSPL